MIRSRSFHERRRGFHGHRLARGTDPHHQLAKPQNLPRIQHDSFLLELLHAFRADPHGVRSRLQGLQRKGSFRPRGRLCHDNPLTLIHALHRSADNHAALLVHYGPSNRSAVLRRGDLSKADGQQRNRPKQRHALHKAHLHASLLLGNRISTLAPAMWNRADLGKTTPNFTFGRILIKLFDAVNLKSSPK